MFVETLVYTLVVYPMMSFEWTLVKFFWFFYVSFFTFLYFTYYGMMTVSISPNGQVASIFAAAFYSFFNLFSGFFVARSVSHTFSFFLLQLNFKNLKPCAMQTLWAHLIFCLVFRFRKSQNGGFGTIGFARWHGQFTGLLCRNTGMWKILSRCLVNPISKSHHLSRTTSVMITISWASWQLCWLASLSSSL